MKDYGARVRRLVEILADVQVHPWDESPEGIDGEAANTSPPSRVQVLNFDNNDQTSYDSSREFLASWQNSDCSIDETTSKVNRRLLIVECMDPLVLELLGVKFKIPPEVFLAHCDGRVNLNVRDSQWKSRGRSTYWRAYVPKYCGLVNDALVPAGGYRVECGRVDRPGPQLMERLRISMAPILYPHQLLGHSIWKRPPVMVR